MKNPKSKYSYSCILFMCAHTYTYLYVYVYVYICVYVYTHMYIVRSVGLYRQRRSEALQVVALSRVEDVAAGAARMI